MPLSDIVQISITAQNVGPTQLGFGVPMILSVNAPWSDQYRVYTNTAAILTDGFSVTGPEYLAAVAIFDQTPSVQQIVIGRGTHKPTMQYQLGAEVQRASDSTSYQIGVTGFGITPTTASYTTDSTPTNQEIHNGLLTSLNAVAGKNYTATFAPLPSFVAIPFTVGNAGTGTLNAAGHGLNTGDGPIQLTTTGTLPNGLATLTNYWVIRVDANNFQLANSLANALAGTIVVGAYTGTAGTNDVTWSANTLSPILPFLVTGSAAGNWFSLQVLDATALSNGMIHSDPGVSTDLAAIATATGVWYGLITLYNSQAYVTAAAAWAQSNAKLYVASVPETAAINTAYTTGSSTDTLGALCTLNYTRTVAAYHPAPNQFFDAAWMGIMLPFTPGQATWDLKTLIGISPVQITATNRTNLIARNGNSYYTVSGLNVTFQGTTASGEFADTIIGLDALENDIQTTIFGILTSSPKVPYTDKGVARLEAGLRAALARGVSNEILSDDPLPTVSVPKVANQAPSDVSSRTLRNLNFNGTLAGAIHDVVIQGNVSV